MSDVYTLPPKKKKKFKPKTAPFYNLSSRPLGNDQKPLVIYIRVPKTGSTSFVNVAYDLHSRNSFRVLHVNITGNSHLLSIYDQVRYSPLLLVLLTIRHVRGPFCFSIGSSTTRRAGHDRRSTTAISRTSTSKGTSICNLGGVDGFRRERKNTKNKNEKRRPERIATNVSPILLFTDVNNSRPRARTIYLPFGSRVGSDTRDRTTSNCCVNRWTDWCPTIISYGTATIIGRIWCAKSTWTRRPRSTSAWNATGPIAKRTCSGCKFRSFAANPPTAGAYVLCLRLYARPSFTVITPRTTTAAAGEPRLLIRNYYVNYSPDNTSERDRRVYMFLL